VLSSREAIVVRKHTMLERALRLEVNRERHPIPIVVVRKHTMLERALRPSCWAICCTRSGVRQKAYNAREGIETSLLGIVGQSDFPEFIRKHTMLERALRPSGIF